MKILMVCLGNICRSPLAEGILRDKINKQNLGHLLEVDSAGTSNYHIGQNPDLRSTVNAKKHGIDISNLIGRQFSKADFESFDLILAMDKSNYNNILALAEKENHRNKVDMILNFTKPGSFEPVPDPYFGGEEGFELVYQLLNEACENLISKLKNKIE